MRHRLVPRNVLFFDSFGGGRSLMPQIGPMEIVMVGVIALLVFGPQRLPGMARGVGRQLADLKRAASEFKSEFDVGLNDTPAAPSGPKAAEPPPDSGAGGGDTP